MKIDQHDNLIRRYLLGELAEADQTALEKELLADRNKFDQVWAIENDLIDNYVRDEMSRADRQRFESHYLASSLHRERVAIAECFLANIDQTTGEAVESGEREPVVSQRRGFLGSPLWVRLALGGAAAAALLLAFGVVWSYLKSVQLAGQLAKVQKEAQAERASLRQREQELAARNQALEKEVADERQRREGLRAQLEQLRQQTQPAPPAALSFLLTPAPVRGENAPPPPTIPLFKGKMRLVMGLDASDYRSYQIRLQTAEGREILRRQADGVSLGKDRSFVWLVIPGGSLAKGDYILILSGRTVDGKNKEIDRYFFQAQ